MKDILEGVGERPWQQCDDFRHVIEDANGNHVCTADKPKFIIHVVNSFEARDQLIAELVEALEDFEKALPEHEREDGTKFRGVAVVKAKQAWTNAEKVLSRAKEVMKG